MPTLDADLRRLAATIVDQAPEPPAFDDLRPVELPSRHRRSLVVTTLVLIGLLALTLAVARPWGDGASRSISVSGAMGKRAVAANGVQNGVAWRIEVYGTRHGLCVDLVVVGVAAGGCGTSLNSVGVSRFLGAGEWVSGRTRPDVTQVRVALSDGRTLDAEPRGHDPRLHGAFYALRLPKQVAAMTVTFLDANGKPETVPVPSPPTPAAAPASAPVTPLMP